MGSPNSKSRTKSCTLRKKKDRYVQYLKRDQEVFFSTIAEKSSFVADPSERKQALSVVHQSWHRHLCLIGKTIFPRSPFIRELV